MARENYTDICVKCGAEFKSYKPERICPECNNKAKKQPSFEKLNEKLIEDVKTAHKLGISYGRYKGDERLWKVKIARSVVQK